LAPDSGKKLVLRNVGAKLPHYGKTISNLNVSCSYANVHDFPVVVSNVRIQQTAKA
jgi:hypothetical protein